MMKKEFEQRIGLVITAEEYTEIEAAYMGLPESVDKDKFVKIWLREGGIQDLLDKRLLRVNSLKETLNNALKENREQEERINELARDCIEYRGQIQTLKNKLADIGAAAMEGWHEQRNITGAA
jgi:hypothetical protein